MISNISVYSLINKGEDNYVYKKKNSSYGLVSIIDDYSIESTDCIFNTGYEIYNNNKIKIYGVIDIINHSNKGFIDYNPQNQIYLTTVVRSPISIKRILDISMTYLLQDRFNNSIGYSENHRYFTPATLCYNGFDNFNVSFGMFVDKTFYNNTMKNTKDKGIFLIYNINAYL